MAGPDHRDGDARGPPPDSRSRRRGRSRSWSRSPPRRRSRSRSPRGRYRSYSPSPDRRSYRGRPRSPPRDNRGGGYPPDEHFPPRGYDGRNPRGPPPGGDPYYRGPPPPFRDHPPPQDRPPKREPRRVRRDEGPPGVSLLIRNVAPDIVTQDLQVAFGRIGEIRDVYIPRDFHSQQPKGFAFIEYATAALASEARDEMDRFVVKGRELEVVFAQERRKTPNEMRGRVVNQQNRGEEEEEGEGAEGQAPPAGRSTGGGGGGFQRSSSFERHKQNQRGQGGSNDRQGGSNDRQGGSKKDGEGGRRSSDG
jgi:FUS-interacting serine-arginine-rich protein 1